MSDLPGKDSVRDCATEGAGVQCLPGPEARAGLCAETPVQLEHMQSALCTLLQSSLGEVAFDEQLRRVLVNLVMIPWLTLEAKGAIFLVEGDPGVLVMKVQHNMAAPLLAACARVPFGKCICGQAAVAGKLQFVNCLDHRHDITYPGIRPHGHYCVPILLQGQVLGVINLYVKAGHVNCRAEEEFLRAAADVIAVMIQHSRGKDQLRQTLSRLRRALRNSVHALAWTVETRDPYTAGHQRRVASLASLIAKEMGLPQKQRAAIRLAAIVHDIGKVSVPAKILTKPGKLSAAEFELIKVHPQVGYDILRRIEFDWPIATIVLQHHERLNGSGYPQGLSGENILLEAKVLAVADVVEAICSHRPYRPALGLDAAKSEITKQRGVFYDACVVDACLRVLAKPGASLDKLLDRKRSLGSVVLAGSTMS